MVLHQSDSLDFEKIWNSVKNQSERQLGAYYFVYAIQFNELPPFLDDKKVQLRNAVIHKGKLASESEAKEFGEYVFQYIRSEFNKLKSKYGDERILLEMKRIHRICKKDFEKAMKNPIPMLDGKQYKGIGGTSFPCFLNMDDIKEYSDCFKSAKKQIYEIGLIK